MLNLRIALLALVVIGAFEVQAQTTAARPDPAVSSPQLAGSGAPGGDYQVGPEDVLEISVWKEDGLKKEVLVRPDGGISFPLAGDMQAAGKTAKEIQEEITRRLGKYIADPVVSVSVLKIANKIYVIGRVNKPGEFVVGRYVDVLQGLSMAGGLTPFAAENDIKVLRKEDGREVTFPFRYSEVKRGTNLEQNIVLKGGDVVVVP